MLCLINLLTDLHGADVGPGYQYWVTYKDEMRGRSGTRHWLRGLSLVNNNRVAFDYDHDGVDDETITVDRGGIFTNESFLEGTCISSESPLQLTCFYGLYDNGAYEDGHLEYEILQDTLSLGAPGVGSVSAGRPRVGLRIWARVVAMALSLGFSLVGGEAAQFLFVKDAVTWIYVKGNSDPVAIVRIASARHDFQQRGYFRIGLLPMAVIEDVKVEICHAGDIGGLLVQTKQGLGMLAQGSALEVRQIAFSFTGESRAAPAGRIHFSI